jgi:mediator of RNA polymerase II transcription subunit 30
MDKSTLEKQNRLQDVLKGIGMLFKRLRVCWDKCQENTLGMEFLPMESLIPLKDDMQDSNRTELEKKRGDTYKSASEEHNELIQQIIFKNRHLKDIIDQMRNIIWEINTMLAMRKS